MSNRCNLDVSDLNIGDGGRREKENIKRGDEFVWLIICFQLLQSKNVGKYVLKISNFVLGE